MRKYRQTWEEACRSYFTDSRPRRAAVISQKKRSGSSPWRTIQFVNLYFLWLPCYLPILIFVPEHFTATNKMSKINEKPDFIFRVFGENCWAAAPPVFNRITLISFWSRRNCHLHCAKVGETQEFSCDGVMRCHLRFSAWIQPPPNALFSPTYYVPFSMHWR